MSFSLHVFFFIFQNLLSAFIFQACLFTFYSLSTYFSETKLSIPKVYDRSLSARLTFSKFFFLSLFLAHFTLISFVYLCEQSNYLLTAFTVARVAFVLRSFYFSDFFIYSPCF